MLLLNSKIIHKIYVYPLLHFHLISCSVCDNFPGHFHCFRNNLLIKLKRSNKENYKIDFYFRAYVRCDTIITVLISLSKRRSAVKNIRRNDSGVFYDFRSLSANDTRSQNTRLLSFSWKFLQLSNCIQRQDNKSTFDLKERRERKRKDEKS